MILKSKRSTSKTAFNQVFFSSIKPHMTASQYRYLIERLVIDGETEMLDRIADQLADCEQAGAILRAKYYGTGGMSLLETVRRLPVAHHKLNY